MKEENEILLLFGGLILFFPGIVSFYVKQDIKKNWLSAIVALAGAVLLITYTVKKVKKNKENK